MASKRDPKEPFSRKDMYPLRRRGIVKQPGKDKDININTKSVGKVILLVIGVLTLFSAIIIVRAGYVGVVEEFGKVTGQFEQGLHFVNPFTTRIIIYDTRVNMLKGDCGSASSDLQSVKTMVALSFSLDGSRIQEIHQNTGKYYKERIIAPSIEDAVKATTAQYTAEGLIRDREAVKVELLENMKERLEPFGILARQVSVEDFKFTDEFDNAIERKQLAETEVYIRKNELEQLKIDAQRRVVEANASAQKLVIGAQANATTVKLQASAIATKILLEKQAEADAIKMIANATATKILKEGRASAEVLRLRKQQMSSELIDMKRAENWDGRLPNYVFGDSSSGPAANFLMVKDLGKD